MTRTASRLANAVALLAIAGAAGVPLLRPAYLSWGSTPEELRARLPGDEFTPAPGYQIQHAVTISATPEEIWPWLAQIGQDRGGFYSYAVLENLVGLQVRNADRIHPEWQDVRAGDLVRAVPAGWLGGRMDDAPGWRVLRVDPHRALVLAGWGAFVLLPIDDRTTRLVIRSRGTNDRDGNAIAPAAAGAMLFEPIHFVMQRRMLLGIKARTERGVRRAPDPIA